MHCTHNIQGDLSEGSSCGSESDDQPCKLKSSVLKAFGSPKVTAAKNGPTGNFVQVANSKQRNDDSGAVAPDISHNGCLKSHERFQGKLGMYIMHIM